MHIYDADVYPIAFVKINYDLISGSTGEIKKTGVISYGPLEAGKDFTIDSWLTNIDDGDYILKIYGMKELH